MCSFCCYVVSLAVYSEVKLCPLVARSLRIFSLLFLFKLTKIRKIIQCTEVKKLDLRLQAFN